MNYLAHFHLAWPREDLVLGALEGDYHKGPLPGTLAESLQAGVALHRAIDAYTDAHPLVATQRQRFPPRLRRYAGILIDLCFDHFLARHWQAHSALPRETFNTAVYAILASGRQQLSAGARGMATRLRDYDVLARYQQWDTIVASAARIGQRLRRENPLHDVDRALGPLLPGLEQGFRDFYPELVSFAREHTLTAGPEAASTTRPESPAAPNRHTARGTAL